MGKKPRCCYFCSHHYVCKYMKSLEKLIEEMPWEVKNVSLYDLVYKPMLSLVAKRCMYFDMMKSD